MPTIDQLAPATAASDSDELLASQGGIARKVTRAQILAGVQPQLAIEGGTLLGRNSAGIGAPEPITLGANLLLNTGTLSASGTSFLIPSLAAGTVPVSTDIVALGQHGQNMAVSYAQFMAGLSVLTNLDVSQLLVKPTGGSSLGKLADWVANTLPLAGGSLTGPLSLAADPTTSPQAATKRYVDAQVATALPKAGGTLTGALTLTADPAVALQAATKQYVDNRVLRSGDTLTGPLLLAADPTVSAQAATKNYVDQQAATALPKAGGTLAGPLTLAADPSATMQAATKRYVDTAANATGVLNVKSAPYNAALNGTTDDTAAFKAAYQAAAAGSVIYVPNGSTVLQNPSSWGVPLTKRVKWIVDGTILSDGTSLANAVPGGTGPASNYLPGIVVGNSGISAEISQNGSQPTDFSVLHSSYIVNHTGGPTGGVVQCNTRNDTIIYNSPNNFVWGGLDRLLWCGVQGGSGNLVANHVARYFQTIRQNVGTDANGKPLVQPQLWCACLEYRDTTGHPSSWANASLTVEMDWFGNGADDANSRIIQSLVVGQHDTSGAPVEIATVVGVYLAAGHTGHAYHVFSVNIPFSVAAFDTTAAQQMPGAAAIRLAAGQSIAFEPTNSCTLSYDSATNTLRWNQGTLSYIVGKGITVGWMNVYSASASLPAYLAGNIVFLIGNGAAYTITLPAATSVAAGTGFSFSVLGSAAVTILPSGTDAIDAGPIILHQNDRYHIVSDASGTWREVFRTNAVNPHFTAPPVLPAYTVAALPTGMSAGALAFATNGRKPSEGASAGSGVQAFYDGSHWISVSSGTQVQA